MKSLAHWNAGLRLLPKVGANIQHISHVVDRLGPTEGVDEVGQPENTLKDEPKAILAFSTRPIREGDPKYSTWTLWVRDDELGTLVSRYPQQ